MVARNIRAEHPRGTCARNMRADALPKKIPPTLKIADFRPKTRKNFRGFSFFSLDNYAFGRII